MTEIINSANRTPSAIAAEIRFLDRQAAATCVQYIIEIGRRLVEAKALVGDGNWLNYIKTELNYERSTAQNYMRLYERFGTGQESMFGNFANSQTFASLTYSKALALLKVPDEELEEFAETHDIEAMSTRELQQAIKERDDANSKLEELRQERDENLQEAICAKEDLEKAQEQVERLTAGVEEAVQKLERSQEREEQLRSQMEEAKAREVEAVRALDEARANPEIPTAMMEELRSKAEAEAARKAGEEAQKKLAQVEAEKAAIREQLQKSEEQLEQARRSVQLADPDVAVFKSLFAGVQEEFNRLHGALLKVRQSNPEAGAKLTAAVKALLEKLGKDVS